MVHDNLLDIMIIFISIPFITMIVVTLVYIVDITIGKEQVVTELRKKLKIGYYIRQMIRGIKKGR